MNPVKRGIPIRGSAVVDFILDSDEFIIALFQSIGIEKWFMAIIS